jgi:hypothetical protein
MDKVTPVYAPNFRGYKKVITRAKVGSSDKTTFSVEKHIYTFSFPTARFQAMQQF